jgi:hypothetical protein
MFKGYHLQNGPDTAGMIRKMIVFELVLID